ncbi:hypothetical protein N7495_008204 [Penicillium taxi]|uniref:uncharacterized protein n=1 Tax=Penicillium taxi TaxID=168475 RepID=UPI002544D875|nr:uncharacterized protein N7495_008204 [Penicillium taxi]KAJ5888163.1 hypothetical protein N7495_008204 [Penicillium taxi]
MASVMPKPATRIGVRSRNAHTPVGRLATSKAKTSGSISINRPVNRPQPNGMSQQPRPTAPAKQSCPNPSCDNPNVTEDGGNIICASCATVISEANIVSEITFGETSSGAAMVQGTFVGEDQTHTRSFGPGFQRGGGMESREMTEVHGNQFISQVSRALNLPESASKAAGQIFKLAVGMNFIQGRRTKNVAAVCLYIACRRQNGNTAMLIDFSDVLMINVFNLGRTYKALLDELRLSGSVFIMNPTDPESLIYRFAKQLEFGSSTMAVAGEACRIVQRMNRDWMTVGRRPAGICGAALILAARMNNFRRTIREVVYVVKVTEVTISERLNEFGSTESGDLTVDEFRSVSLESEKDPPAYTRASKGRLSKRLKQPETYVERGDPVENDDDNGEDGTPQPWPVDADGFAIPRLPIDPALTALDGAVEQAKGKKKEEQCKKSKQPLPTPTSEQIASEEALEEEMRLMLDNGEMLAKVEKHIPDTAEIEETEFESDPEVQNCLLSSTEIDLKELVWVHENKEWLRFQQQKALKRALDEANPHKTSPRKSRKRRKGRMGDVGYLEGDETSGRSRALTPAEATRRMLEMRGFSKKINYSALDNLYGGKNGPPSDYEEPGSGPPGDNGGGRSRSGSAITSRRSASLVSEETLGPYVRRRGRLPATAKVPVEAPAPQQPTPPSTAPAGISISDEVVIEEGTGSKQPDIDEVEDDEADYAEDDNLDDAFAGAYKHSDNYGIDKNGDDYADDNYASDYDYGSD